jgi:hypothetical protein
VKVSFLPIADEEQFAALKHYDSISVILGDRFAEDATAVECRIADNPFQFPRVYRSLHRAMFKHFPYAYLFRLSRDGIVIVACLHLHSQPRLRTFARRSPARPSG